MWDILLLLISIFHFIRITLFIGFELSMLPGLFDQTMDNLSLFFYLLDILLNFHTTYYDAEGDEIFHSRMICRRYARRGLLFDALAAFPFHLFSIRFLQLVSLIKMARLKRIFELIRRANLSYQQKVMLRLISFLILIPFIFHTLACIWNSVQRSSAVWIAPLFWIDPSLAALPRPFIFQYFKAYYYNLIGVLVGGEVGATTPAELVLASILFIFGQIFNATTLAAFSILILEMNRRSMESQARLSFANEAMENIELPLAKRRIVRLYLISAQKTLHKSTELQLFLESIPPSLKEKVLIFMFCRFLHRNQLFNKTLKLDSDIFHSMRIMEPTKNYSDVATFSSCIEPLFTEPDETIINYDSQPHALFFVANGECQISRRCFSWRAERRMHSLRRDEMFGLPELLFNSRAIKRVVSKKYSVLGMLPKQNFKKLSSSFPMFEHYLREKLMASEDPWTHYLSKYLRRLAFFKDLSPYKFARVVNNCQMLQFQQQQLIFGWNSLPTGLYVIVRGHVILETRGEVPLVLLEAGAVLNYDRITHQYVCQQTAARAVTFTTLAFLSNQAFIYLAKKNLSIRKEIRRAQKMIDLNGLRPYALDYYKTQRERRNAASELKRNSLFAKRKTLRVFRLPTTGAPYISQFSVDSECDTFELDMYQHTQSVLGVDEVQQAVAPAASPANRLERMTFRGGRDTLFKFRNCVLQVMAGNRMEMRRLGIVQRAKLQIAYEAELEKEYFRTIKGEAYNPVLKRFREERERRQRLKRESFENYYEFLELNERLINSSTAAILELAMKSTYIYSASKQATLLLRELDQQYQPGTLSSIHSSMIVHTLEIEPCTPSIGNLSESASRGEFEHLVRNFTCEESIDEYLQKRFETIKD